MNKLYGTPIMDELSGNRSGKDVKRYNDKQGFGRISVYDSTIRRYLNEEPRPAGAKYKVRVYTKETQQGNVYELEGGSYTNEMLRKFMITSMENSNIFSLSLPPKTTITLYSGNDYDLGGKGAVSYTNVTNDVMRVNSLPIPLAGNIHSIDITHHTVDPESMGVERTFLDSKTIDSAITDRGDLVLSGHMLNDYRLTNDALGLDGEYVPKDSTDDNTDNTNNKNDTEAFTVNNVYIDNLYMYILIIALCLLIMTFVF
jgi:hypothetical protein